MFFADAETGEIKPNVIQQNHPVFIVIPLLCDGRGRNVIPANLYIRSKALHDPDANTLKDYAQALLAFYRFMAIRGTTIFDVSSVPEKGVVYKFRDFLLENLKREVNGVTEGMYAPSTAKQYILKVVGFYNYLNAQRIIRISDDFVPFIYKTISVRRSSKNSNNRKLGHLDKQSVIQVETTSITKPFGRKQNQSPSHRLTPMTEGEIKIFLKELGEDFSNPKDLMLKLALSTGLRLEEFVTFPASEVKDPQAPIVKCTISEVRNGCLTKYNKERTIVVPFALMNELNQYKLSKARNNAFNRALINHNCLFIKSDGYPYSTNTIEKHFEAIRDKVRESNPDWYFTIHDLRATFATHWLYNKHIETGMIFDALLEDLKNIMGHKETTTTEKYIKYMDTQENWFKFARSQNQLANKYLSSTEEDV